MRITFIAGGPFGEEGSTPMPPTPRSFYIGRFVDDPERISILQRGRASSEAFREEYSHSDAAQKDETALPYEYEFHRQFFNEKGGFDYGKMIANNEEGMMLSSQYIGQRTMEYLKVLSDKEDTKEGKEVLPSSCLSPSVYVIDAACGTAGFLEASPAYYKYGIDLDSQQLEFAKNWGREKEGYSELVHSSLNYQSMCKKVSELPKAHFMHLGAPPTEFFSPDRTEGFMKGIHYLMDKENEDSRIFIGLPMNAISLGKALKNDTDSPYPRDQYFITAIKKYFDILDVSEASDRDDITQGRLIGDAHAYGIILKPKSNETIALEGFEGLKIAVPKDSPPSKPKGSKKRGSSTGGLARGFFGEGGIF